MTDRLRDLAGKIDKATPGEWFEDADEIVAPITLSIGKKGRIAIAYVNWENRQDCDEDGHSDQAEADAHAICLARNEAPALLREAADEIERLRRVVDQAIKIGFIRIDDFRVCVTGGSACVVEIERLAPELVQELKEAQ